MIQSLRFAAILVASLTLSSVAAAQGGDAAIADSEPLIAVGSNPILASLGTESADTAALSPFTSREVSPAQARAKVAAPSGLSGSLSGLVAKLRSSAVATRELECLAGAIYFESKSEPLAGQLAVGEVIANRARSGRFASSYCGVVFQRGQFSFVRGRSLPAIPRASLQWRTAVAVANIVDKALQLSQVPKALFFHARRVAPGWRLTRLGAIGNHIFYR